jgi:uncharacterized coiled-coil DUF342 family protein
MSAQDELRAAAERCAELETADARRERFAKVAALTRSVDQGCEMVTRLSLKLNEAEAALANVTAERDEARSCAAEMRDSLHDAQPSIDEGPSEWMPLTWERATPTEGA